MKDIFGESQVYKNIEFKPLKLKEYEKFYFVRLLSLYHKRIEGETIRKMSFIKFLIIYLIESEVIDMGNKTEDYKEENNFKAKYHLLEYLYALFGNDNYDEVKVFDTLLDVFSDNINECSGIIDFKKFLSFICCVDYNDIEFYLEFTRMGKLLVHLKIKESDFNDAEFEDIRQLILKQSGVDFKFIEEYDEDSEIKIGILNKSSKTQKHATLAEQIATFSIILQKNPAELKEYTFYQLDELTKRENLLSDYNTFKSLEAAGFIKFKDKTINHYLTHIGKKGRYDDLYMSEDKFAEDVLNKLGGKD